ncbi:hypothetical protein FB451DRAFT_1193838 [Mycena latifolia]|nr:hypothetical protein FB451DRAFT_1193838 [Mycena latifolia]
MKASLQLSSPSRSPSPAESLSDYGDMEIPDIAELDSIAYLEVDTDHDDNYNEEDQEEIATENFNKCLLDMISRIEEDRQDAGDNDWLPTRERYEAQRKIARQKPGGIFFAAIQCIWRLTFKQAGQQNISKAQIQQVNLSAHSDAMHDDEPLAGVVDNSEEEEEDPNDWDEFLDEMLDADQEETLEPEAVPETRTPSEETIKI